jgi:PTH2 family peptidyl-tRNA hydrolase
MMSELVKQVVVVRKDLNMRKGKLAAQVAHASMKVLLDGMFQNHNKLSWSDPKTDFHEWKLLVTDKDPLYEWLTGRFTKIVVYVESEEELKELQAKANLTNVRSALIQDAGNTEFNGVPTYTCLAIGPSYAERIDAITGELPLI